MAQWWSIGFITRRPWDVMRFFSASFAMRCSLSRLSCRKTTFKGLFYYYFFRSTLFFSILPVLTTFLCLTTNLDLPALDFQSDLKHIRKKGRSNRFRGSACFLTKSILVHSLIYCLPTSFSFNLFFVSFTVSWGNCLC